MDALVRSKRAQMPFSVAAVLILIFSSTTVVLLHQLDLDSDHREPFYLLNEMKEVASGASIEFEEAAYGAAIEATRTSISVDEGELRERFRNHLNEYVARHYPSLRSGMEIDINASSVSISFLMMAIEELHQGVGDTSTWNVSSVPAYFTIVGVVTIIVVEGASRLLWNHSLDREVYLPLPLLANRIQALESALSGGRCEFENVVRYQLSALAQDRVLRGYGMGSRDGIRGTHSILTEDDVSRAIELALALELKRHIRAVPEQLRRSFPTVDFDALGGIIDPAALFLTTYDEGPYELSRILAQALYASVDTIVIRWLDYFHIMDLARWSERILDEGQIMISEILDECLGTSVLRDSMVSWIRNKMNDAGYAEQNYRYMHYGGPDAVIEVPAMTFVFINDQGEKYPFTVGGRYEVDFPSQDIFRAEGWGGFLSDYKRNTFELAEMLRDFLLEVVVEISESTGLASIRPAHDPMDGVSFVDEITGRLKHALLDPSSWMEDSVESSIDRLDFMGSMEEAFLDFLRMGWESLFSAADAVLEGVSQISKSIVDEYAQDIPDFGRDSRRMAFLELNNLFINTTLWNIYDDVLQEFRRAIDWRIDLFEEGLLVASGLRKKGMKGLVAEMAKGLVKDIPGLKLILFDLMSSTLKDIADGYSLRNDMVLLPIPAGGSFSVIDADGHTIEETIRIEDSTEIINLEIGLIEPWKHDRSLDLYPNRHITEPRETTLSPYTTQWNISFSGALRISLMAEGTISRYSGVLGSAWTGFIIPFGTDITVVSNSGWPLKGVAYSPTCKILDDVIDFLGKIWEGVVDALKFVAEGIGKTFSFFKSAFSTLLTYSMSAFNALSNALQGMIAGLQDMLMGVGMGVIGALASLIESLLGTISFNLTIFGMRFTVETNVFDLALGQTKDLLKVTFSMSVLGSVISHSVRLVKLGGGNYDFIINCTLATDNWRLSVVVDPLMKLFNHFVEIKGMFHGFTLLLHIPKVFQYEKYRLSLADLPGVGQFLANIPLPIPGMKGSLDAGFEMKFNRPFVSHPVINEYEQNPPGPDAGNEWLELYNPTDRAISLKGWTLETSHGVTRAETLGDITIMPHSYIVYTFSRQTLDNGGDAKFPISECIVLKNEEGVRVDSTPWTTDFYNDGRTWQREYDGSDRWVFKEATKGQPNGKMMVKSSEMSFLKNALWDSAAQAFAEMRGLNHSIMDLAEFSKRTLENFWSRCIDLISNAIVEMRFFVEVMVGDITSTIGGGFEVSLVITRECVREAISWMASQLLEVLSNLMNPLTTGLRESSILRIGEHIHLRISVFTEAGLPRMLMAASQGMSFRMTGMIQANLACIGVICGKEWGAWEIGFGAMLEGVPGGYLPRIFAVDADRVADIWLIRGAIFAP